MKKIFVSRMLALFFCMIVSCFFVSERVCAEDKELSFYAHGNENAQDYSVWSNCMKSFLVEDEEGYCRIDANMSGGDILVDHYNREFRYKSHQWVTMELPLFGGFYAGKDSYFCVFGQENLEESNDKEVIRVVKYDKKWNRLSSVSLYGANTTIPFRAGNCRMIELDGMLYIHTSHQMFKSEDGLNHQANLTLMIDIMDMKLTVTHGFTYVSHSFNQFIQNDGESIYYLDHGDAYPRSIRLSKSNRYEAKSEDILEIFGEIGNNSTGVSIGGLECSLDTCITVGNSIVQDVKHDTDDIRNIYVTATKKDSMEADNNTIFRWLTSYRKSDDMSPSTPQLVKINDNLFLVLWNLLSEEDEIYKKPIGKFCYAFIDSNGNLTGNIHTETGVLSDCQPILSKNKILWYISKEKSAYCIKKEDGSNELWYEAGGTVFYSLALDGKLTKSVAFFPEEVTVNPKSIANCRYIFTAIGNIKASEYDKYSCLIHNGTMLKREKDYEVNYTTDLIYQWDNSIFEVVEAHVIGKMPYFEGEFTFRISYIDQKPKLKSVKRSKCGVKISWNRETGAQGYYLYRKIGNGNYECIKKLTESAQTVEDESNTSWVDSIRLDKEIVTYAIKAYTWDNEGKEILTQMSNELGITAEIPVVSSVKCKIVGNKKIKVSWKKISEVKGYEIWISNNKKFKPKKRKYVEAMTYTFKNLKRKKAYYIKIRGYSKWNGKKNYGKWSKVKRIKVK